MGKMNKIILRYMLTEDDGEMEGEYEGQVFVIHGRVVVSRDLIKPGSLK